MFSGLINSLPNNTILDWSKLKVFAGDKINVTEKLKSVLGRVENIVGKVENVIFTTQSQLLITLGKKPYNPFPNKPWFLRVCSTSLLKTLWKKKELLIMSNFSVYPSIFYPFGELAAIFIKFKIVFCKII